MAGAITREIMEAAGHKTLSQAARITPTCRPNILSPWWTGSRERALLEPNMHQNMHRRSNSKAGIESVAARLI
jgi:hypothetical protein